MQSNTRLVVSQKYRYSRSHSRRFFLLHMGSTIKRLGTQCKDSDDKELQDFY